MKDLNSNPNNVLDAVGVTIFLLLSFLLVCKSRLGTELTCPIGIANFSKICLVASGSSILVIVLVRLIAIIKNATKIHFSLTNCSS